jgi:DNA-binding CsgD family transcriptional regulator
MDLGEFIEQSREATTAGELFDLLVRAAADLGFERLAYGALTSHETVDVPGRRGPALLLNYPRDWQEHYFKCGYHLIDPVVTQTPALDRPYLWSDMVRKLDHGAPERRIFDEARDAGLKSGLSVPLHGPWGRVGVLSFASQFDDAEPSPKINHLNLLASQFHVAFEELNDSLRARRTVQLSAREADCLRWTAEGKSAWDVGMILGISENTANFHVKNAMKKLNTSSRTVAVLKAIRLNLLDPPYRWRQAS